MMLLLCWQGLLSLRQVNLIVSFFCALHKPLRHFAMQKRAGSCSPRAMRSSFSLRLQQPLQPHSLAVHRGNHDNRRLLRILDDAGQLVLLR